MGIDLIMTNLTEHKTKIFNHFTILHSFVSQKQYENIPTINKGELMTIGDV